MQNLQTVRHGRRAVDPTAELREFDPLTGLATRALFRQRLDEAWDRSSAAHRPLGLLLVEVNDFALCRRDWSKQETRMVLGQLGQCISQSCKRRADFAARTRLHQMAMILSDADLEGSRLVAGRLLDEVRALNIFSRPDQPLSVSIGVAAALPSSSHFASSLLMAADEALRRAIEMGPGQIAEA